MKKYKSRLQFQEKIQDQTKISQKNTSPMKNFMKKYKPRLELHEKITSAIFKKFSVKLQVQTKIS